MTSFFRLLKLYRDKFRLGSEAVEQEKVFKVLLSGAILVSSSRWQLVFKKEETT